MNKTNANKLYGPWSPHMACLALGQIKDILLERFRDLNVPYRKSVERFIEYPIRQAQEDSGNTDHMLFWVNIALRARAALFKHYATDIRSSDTQNIDAIMRETPVVLRQEEYLQTLKRILRDDLDSPQLSWAKCFVRNLVINMSEADQMMRELRDVVNNVVQLLPGGQNQGAPKLGSILTSFWFVENNYELRGSKKISAMAVDGISELRDVLEETLTMWMLPEEHAIEHAWSYLLQAIMEGTLCTPAVELYERRVPETYPVLALHDSDGVHVADLPSEHVLQLVHGRCVSSLHAPIPVAEPCTDKPVCRMNLERLEVCTPRNLTGPVQPYWFLIDQLNLLCIMQRESQEFMHPNVPTEVRVDPACGRRASYTLSQKDYKAIKARGLFQVPMHCLPWHAIAQETTCIRKPTLVEQLYPEEA